MAKTGGVLRFSPGSLCLGRVAGTVSGTAFRKCGVVRNGVSTRRNTRSWQRRAASSDGGHEGRGGQRCGEGNSSPALVAVFLPKFLTDFLMLDLYRISIPEVFYRMFFHRWFSTKLFLPKFTTEVSIPNFLPEFFYRSLYALFYFNEKFQTEFFSLIFYTEVFLPRFFRHSFSTEVFL